MPKVRLLTIGRMWNKSSAAAGNFFSGRTVKLPDDFEWKEGAKLFIFENRSRKQENSPTHLLMTEDTRPAGRGGDPEEKKGDPPMGFEGFATPEDKAPW